MKKAKFQATAILSIVVCFILVFSVVVIMTVKNTEDLQSILKDSIKSQLISISIAARDMLDVEQFERYNTLDDILKDEEAYSKTLQELRALQSEVGAEYIYALKEVNGKYYFIFDTDSEDVELYVEYELAPVHELAFTGVEAADVMNVADEYGTFNTGAVPIIKDGVVIGIVSTDIEDTYLVKSEAAAKTNAVVLIATMLITMGAVTAVIILLLRRVRKMQDHLFKMANYDALTGLPNRQYLMDYLRTISKRALKSNEPFALMFIDLDNFKTVNDSAGHDAGDELLRHIALYLDNIHEDSKAFRPTAGILNISARIGGDEFVQIVPNISNVQEAEAAAQKIFANFNSEDIDRFVEKFQVGLSVGVAIFPSQTEDFNVLIKYADIAMYHAKKNGKNSYCVYSDGLKKE